MIEFSGTDFLHDGVETFVCSTGLTDHQAIRYGSGSRTSYPMIEHEIDPEIVDWWVQRIGGVGFALSFIGELWSTMIKNFCLGLWRWQGDPDLD